MKASIQQSIKIIAEIVVNMNIVVRNNISRKLKDLSFEIGYYSYTKRCVSYPKKNQPHKLHIWFLPSFKAKLKKPKEQFLANAPRTRIK